jgi:hypothetical protein
MSGEYLAPRKDWQELMATIEIGSFSSKCGNCGKSASPSDDGHTTIYGYGPENGSPGCGEPWTAVSMEQVICLPTEPRKFKPLIGMVFENLRGLPMVGMGTTPDMKYPNDEQLNSFE